jgi:hypothetical protein
MRAFTCKHCRELAPFESFACPHCGVALGFDPASGALELAGGDGHGVRCVQAKAAFCNWLLPAVQAGGKCRSCQLTRTYLPAKANKEHREAFAKAEMAKRRLMFQIGELGLPVVSREEDPNHGLAFDLLAGGNRVVTGHDNGVITIDLNETDDAFRENTRAQFGEPYRTLLGHFRHEIGHYYWCQLALREDKRPGNGGPSLLDEARVLFGDEKADYEAARERHYAYGPGQDWSESYVSAYAAMHPLEDWAETFAHYLHIHDAVQTASSHGVLVTGPVDDRTGRRDPAKAAVPSEDTASEEGFHAVIAHWLPLTVALNALNRSLGKEDLYPFELSPAVVSKLAFVHKVISTWHLRLGQSEPVPG